MKKRRSVFITGATGSVGRALVTTFSREGYRVTFQYHSNKSLAHKLAEKYGAASCQIDFSEDYELPDTAFDIIINGAGVNISSVLVHEVTDTGWATTMRTNLLAPFVISRKYLPGMMKRRWGRIINISSIYGLRGVENNSPYNVSKHGLSGLTKSIAKEYASYRITCNEICPAAIESKMMTRIALEQSKSMGISTKEYFASVCDEIPAKRMAKPTDVAEVALFLASDEAGFINGASITVDGGMIA